MASPLHEGLIGSQEPTLHLAPPRASTEGDLAIEFGRTCGYDLLPWQQNWLLDGLGLDEHGDLAASDVVIVLSRQQGKSAALEVLVLYCLFVARYTSILYTAHKAETARKFFGRIQAAIKRAPQLQAELMPDRSGGVRTGNGQWEIRTRTGQVASFRTRTNDGGRGLDEVELLVIDESQNCTDDQMAALQPTTLAAQSPQIWWAGSAGGPHSAVLGALVRNAENGEPGMVYHGWHAEETDPPDELATWIKTNPSLGALVPVKNIASAQRRFPPSKFAREHLGIGDYPREAGEEWVIPEASWEGRLDEDSAPAGPVVFVPDSTADLEWSSIAVAGRRTDGDIHLEVVAHERGSTWLGPRLVELARRHDCLGIGVDPKSPSASTVLAGLKDAHDEGLLTTPVHEFSAEEVKNAWTWLNLAAKRSPLAPPAPSVPGVWHRGAEVLTQALAAAKVRRLLDQFTWSRKGEADTSPLIAATNAGYLVQLLERTVPPPVPRSGRSTPPSARRRSATAGPSTADLAMMQF